MRKLTFFMGILWALTACQQKAPELLFNGQNLDNWEMIAADETIDPQSLFKVEDGVIKVAGSSNGYLRTREVFNNYQLHLEWRWTEKPTNSGVLLHVNGYDFWPNAIEAQLQHEHAGDVVFIGNGISGTIADSTYTNKERRFTIVPKYTEGIEKPAGEWNSYDIICERDKISIYVNGTLQNEAKNLSLTGGAIGLQSEGSPIEFRNVYLEKGRSEK
ncbi:MAG: DUF1080 domain-containing protein [Prolixibacteraceae bacterium]|nr:DUF1080 domain-containing protein [Prolixibacteraceae bacterium]